jgi:hypothetical protein
VNSANRNESDDVVNAEIIYVDENGNVENRPDLRPARNHRMPTGHYIRTTRNIKPGEQVLVRYPDMFWPQFAYARRLLP